MTCCVLCCDLVALCCPVPCCCFREYTSSDEAFVVSLNGVCCYTLVKGLLPSMLEAGQGAIVGISSLMSRCGTMAGTPSSELI